MQYLYPLSLKAIIYNILHPGDEFPIKFFTVEEIEDMIVKDAISALPTGILYFVKRDYVYEITEDEENELLSIDKGRAGLFLRGKRFELDDLLVDNSDRFWEIIKNYLYINVDKDKLPILEEYLSKYIDNFANQNLQSINNYYSLDKHLYFITLIFKECYKKFGNCFTIKENFYVYLSNNKFEKDFNSFNFRLYEILLYLEKKEYIKIIDYSFTDRYITSLDKVSNNEDKYPFHVKILLKKTPSEFYDIEKYWSYYGDIRVNETDGVAYYKNSRYPFKSTKGKAFKLLCFLVKNHGRKISIKDAYKAVYENDSAKENITFKEKKNYIKDYIKEIKKNLGILEDENPSLDIMVIKDSVLLISNPPIKK